MALQATPRQINGVTILDLSGTITLDGGSATLRQVMADLLTKDHNRILLNLADVSYVDSTGIGELVSAFTTTKKRGGQIKLLNLTKKIRDLLLITKLYTIFDVHSDEQAAVKSFG